MAEEKITYTPTSSDDASVLRVLLHNIKGISPVSTTAYVTIPVEDE